MAERFLSFEEFWPYYVSQHRNPVCRALHVLGTTCVIAGLAAAVLDSPWWLVAVPLAGYGFAWIGPIRSGRSGGISGCIVSPSWAGCSRSCGGRASCFRLGPEARQPTRLPTSRRMNAELLGQPDRNSQDSRMPVGASSRGKGVKPRRPK
jgi:2-hydroxy-palmitic acid dioxygenase Mpo1-like